MPRELKKCKRLMFELDFGNLGEGQAMDRRNPRSLPRALASPAAVARASSRALYHACCSGSLAAATPRLQLCV